MRKVIFGKKFTTKLIKEWNFSWQIQATVFDKSERMPLSISIILCFQRKANTFIREHKKVGKADQSYRSATVLFVSSLCGERFIYLFIYLFTLYFKLTYTVKNITVKIK